MAITDLTGTTWIINVSPTISYDLIGYDVNFTTNNTSYWAFIQDEGNIRYVGNTTAYAYGDGIGWTNEAYRTVVFTGGDDITNTSLITWLQANAIIQTNDYFTCTDELKSIADAIRIKGGTSASLTYPSGFVTAINNLPTKVLGAGTISGYDSPFDIQVTADDYSAGNWDGFSSVSINISTPFYDGSCDIIDPVRIIEFTAPVGTPDPEALRPGQLIWTQPTLQAEDGMTWGEWLESEYNTVGFVAHGIYYIAVDSGDGAYILSTTTSMSQEACRLTDTIVAGFDYVKILY